MSPNLKIITKPPLDLLWSVPEQNSGHLAILGGHLHSFKTTIHLSEYAHQQPFKSIQTILPQKLQTLLPPLPHLSFSPDTDSGSFASSKDLKTKLQPADGIIFAGEFSKNSTTTIALSEVLTTLHQPLFINHQLDPFLPVSETLASRPIHLLAPLSEIQKLFLSLLYPKMLLLTAPLLNIADQLRKFSLSYPIFIITLHQDKILLAHQGQIQAIPLSATNYTPLTLWAGEPIVKIAGLNLWNPNQSLAATTSAFFL